VKAQFAYFALPVKPTDPTSASLQPEGSVTTANVELLADRPPTVISKVPEVADVGTSAMMLVLDQFVTTAVVPFREIVLLPCVSPKPLPMIVTGMPTGPDVGEIDVTVGA
jgi:hypothetical protein